MNNEISLKRCEESDIVLLSDVSGRSFTETYRNKMPIASLETYVANAFNIFTLLAELREVDNHFILAYYLDRPAGYLKLNYSSGNKYFKSNTVEIERLYLLKEFQGKKIGSALMDYSFHIANERKCSAVWLAVWERNNKALEYYRKYGFHPFFETIYMRGNDEQKAILMQRQM